jgi:hypothetical protein
MSLCFYFFLFPYQSFVVYFFFFGFVGGGVSLGAMNCSLEDEVNGILLVPWLQEKDTVLGGFRQEIPELRILPALAETNKNSTCKKYIHRLCPCYRKWSTLCKKLVHWIAHNHTKKHGHKYTERDGGRGSSIFLSLYCSSSLQWWKGPPIYRRGSWNLLSVKG